MAAIGEAPAFKPGTLFVVATPIGNLEDITIRALRVLRDVAIIAAEDTRRTAHLLARHAIATKTTSLHEHNERTKSASLVARLARGEDVALVSDAGTPTVSDPGARLIRAAIDAGIRVEPIPGPSAILATLVASGLPADTFTFLGFPPVRAKDRKSWFERATATPGTVVFFEAPHRLDDSLRTLRQLAGECIVAVGREMTKIHEQLVRGPISEVIGGSFPRVGEFTVVAIIGLKPELGVSRRPGPHELLAELGQIATDGRLTRRRAIAELSRRHGLSPNEVYAAIESAKKSGC